MDRRSLVATLGVALGSGCLRLGSGSSSTPTRTATRSPTQTLTDSPTPTAADTLEPTETDTPTETDIAAETDTATQTASDQLPTGLSTDGVSPLLAGNHTTELVDRSFTLQYILENVGESRKVDSVQKAGPEAIWDGDFSVPRYTRLDTKRMNWRRTFGESPLYGDIYRRSGARVTTLVQEQRLRRQFNAGNFGSPQELSNDGMTIFETTASSVSNPAPLEREFRVNRISSFNATLRVRATGIVDSFTATIEVVRDGEFLEYDQSYQISNVDETTVTKPTWVSAARQEAPELDGSVVDSGQAMAIEHTGGQDVPRQTQIKLVEGELRDTAQFPRTLAKGETLYAALTDKGSIEVVVGSPPSIDNPVSLSTGYTTVELPRVGGFYKEGIERM